MKDTAIQAIHRHREMWEFLAKNPRLSKYQALVKLGYYTDDGRGDDILSNCFLCDYARDDDMKNDSCRKKCPVVWPSTASAVMCLNAQKDGDLRGIYMRWQKAEDLETKASLAFLIANLPIRWEVLERERNEQKDEEREEAIANHRKMWKLLSENPEWEKEDALREMISGYHGNDIPYDCFMCGICSSICTDCPLAWPSSAIASSCVNCEESDDKGLYAMWADSSDLVLRKQLASLIANLPVK